MNNQIEFLILGLKTEQFAIFEEGFSEKKKSEFITNIDFKANQKANQIGVFATFTFEQAKKPVIKLEISCHFGIESNSWDNCKLDNKIIFPKDFMIHLAMITIGSARGVLHAKTEGTNLNKIVLPTIDIRKLVQKDIEFNFTNN
jgi:hypothetical protein